MFELIVRVVFATAVLLVSGMTGEPPFDTAWRTIAFFSTYSFFGYAMDRRGVRNAGVSGLFAVADSAAIAVLLASAGRLDTFGFLTLVPPAWAALRYGSDAISMAPITAAWLLIGANLFDGPGWTPILLCQTLGVLTVGLLGARRIQWVKVKELIEVPAAEPAEAPMSQDVFDLREKFRVLRDHSAEVERKAIRDRIIVQMMDTFESDPDAGLVGAAKKLQEALRVDGLTIYAYDQDADQLTVNSVAGNVPVVARDTAFSLPSFVGEWQLKDRLEKSILAMKTPEDVWSTSTLILKDRGRIVGVLGLFDASRQRLADCLDTAGTIAESLARMIRTSAGREATRIRLRQTELLYQIAGLCHGSDSPPSLASRVVRELWETVRLDHLSICFVSEGESSLAAFKGANMSAFDYVTLPTGHGFEGWQAAGGPELVLLDARNDDRMDRADALKQRVGSFVLIPLMFDDEPYGYMTAMTNRVHGIDAQTLDVLRVVGSELGQAIGRIEHGHRDPAGLTTPAEFHEIVSKAGTGFFVYLDVLRREELVDSHGRAAVEFVARKLAGRLRALLPAGGVLCRRPEGDFVAYLRTGDESVARKWATNAAATASLLALTSTDGKTKIPMPIRSKVAQLAPQSNRISQVASSV